MKIMVFPSSERRGGCAFGADGVVMLEQCFENDHPGAVAPPRLSALKPSPPGKGLGEGLRICRNFDPHPARFARRPLPEGEGLSPKEGN